MKRLTAVCALAIALGCWASASMADPGRGAAIQCYVWANDPSTPGPYTPSTPYSYNAVGRSAANTISRTAVGVYVVTCKGVGGGALFGGSGSWGAGGHVQVTAYGGEDADRCKVTSWATGGADFVANVRCYNRTGALSDNRFDLLFIW
jgi:hypothetical protein